MLDTTVYTVYDEIFENYEWEEREIMINAMSEKISKATKRIANLGYRRWILSDAITQLSCEELTELDGLLEKIENAYKEGCEKHGFEYYEE